MANRHRFSPNFVQDTAPRPARELERCYGGSESGKAIFATEDGARSEAERIRHEEGKVFSVYQCGHCLGWHFTSTVPGHRTIHLTDRKTDRRRNKHRVPRR